MLSEVSYIVKYGDSIATKALKQNELLQESNFGAKVVSKYKKLICCWQ